MSDYADFLKLAPAASAFAAAIAVFSAKFNVIIQNKNIQRNRAIDIVCKKEAEFDGDRLIKHRGLASAALLAGADDNVSVDVILNFMESVAKYEVEGCITAEQVWHTFYDWFAVFF